jgi:8-amino-7-oxononanoate synthase
MFHVKHESPPALLFLEEALEGLRSRDLLRERSKANEVGAASFCSNDYLGLASRHAGNGAVGAGASRLVAGERPEHQALEAAAAALVRRPAALAFTSGYAANVGTISALAQSGDLIVSDALNHASLIDGARLSRARVEIVPHLDTEAVARALKAPRSGRAFVITESYFSMDADAPDLSALRSVCDAYGAALVVDEAHALGVLGPEGRGLCAERAVVPDVLTGTFGKAFGAGGAFVAGCPSLVKWLWNRARSFVFSTGLSPAVASAAEGSIRLSHEHPELRERTLRAAALFRRRLAELGIRPAGFGHVIPWIIGDPATAVRVAKLLREQGMDVLAIRPPSVPDNTARIRLTVTAAHTDADIERAAAAIERVLEHQDVRAQIETSQEGGRR